MPPARARRSRTGLLLTAAILALGLGAVALLELRPGPTHSVAASAPAGEGFSHARAVHPERQREQFSPSPDGASPKESPSAATGPVQRFVDAARLAAEADPGSPARKKAMADMADATKSFGDLDDEARQAVARAWQDFARRRNEE